MSKSLEKSIKQLQQYQDDINLALDSQVKVGLPKEKTSGIAYGDGQTVIEVGAFQEFGTKYIPRRSWLRTAVIHNKKEIDRVIKLRFHQMFDGKLTAEKGLNLIGATVRNFVVKGFSNNGYGTWESLAGSTEKAKNSSVALTDTGLLKQSVTWIVEKK